MTKLILTEWLTKPKVAQILALAPINAKLEKMTASERLAWASENLSGKCALASSFGIQGALMLDLVTKQTPKIPIILTDTGYLFPETYRFIDELTERFSLNLHVYRSHMGSAWQEARYGQLWLKGIDGLKHYNRLNKVEPMRRALSNLNISWWYSGLRRAQSSSRANLPVLSIQNGVFKFLPIIDWTDKDVSDYFETHQLPYHPLFLEGYHSVGDHHTSEKWSEGKTASETRFFWLKARMWFA